MGLIFGIGLLVLGIILITGVFLFGLRKGETQPGTKNNIHSGALLNGSGDTAKIDFNLPEGDPEGLVEHYRKYLRDPDPKIRAIAVERLGSTGGEGVPGLLFRAMADKNEEVRLAATAALKELADPSIAGLLVNALKEPNKWLPARVAEVLISLGSLAVPALRSALEDSDPVFRAYVIEILGEVGDRSSVDTLHLALGDSVANIRRQAAAALGKTGYPGSVGFLVEALNDPEIKVKVQAIRSLGIIGGPEAVRHLTEMAEHSNLAVRCAALDALSHAGEDAPDKVKILFK